MLDKVKFGTFDLSPGVLQAIDEGKMLFAIDQQQYPAGLPADPAAAPATSSMA